MRRLSDKAKISREKLAYICDSTSAPVAVFLPVTSWSAYLCGLSIGIGAIMTQTDAFNLFVKAMPFNFYAIFSVIFVGFIMWKRRLFLIRDSCCSCFFTTSAYNKK